MNDSLSFSFPKALRLRKRFEFLRFREGSTSLLGSFIVIEKRATQENSFPRLGIVASKRFGKAHERNRFKRIAREAFRLNQGSLPKGVEILLKPRQRAKSASMQEIERELVELLRETS